MIKYMLLVGLFLPIGLVAQSLSGKVTDNLNRPIIGASIYWQDTNLGVISGPDGSFEIPYDGQAKKQLIASFIGYSADTILVQQGSSILFKLLEVNELSEVVVKARREGVIISNVNPVKTEQITQMELGKAACCDLAGCFGTQTTVQSQTTNVVTNSKELRILGLSGVYNQVLINGLPMIQGLSYTYGLSSVPGPLVGTISVSKGANSVLQGYESISGQINVETKDPARADKLFLNAYINSFGEQHYNASFAVKKKAWSNVTALHAVQPASRIDRDDDNFMDLPLLTRYLVTNTLKYRDGAEWGWNTQIGIRFLNEQRIGGQVNYNRASDLGSNSVYGQSVQLHQPEIWTRTTYRFNNQNAFTLYASAFQQNQESFFGTLDYQARQHNAYANIQYELNYGDHALKTGLSLRYLNLNEDIRFTEAEPFRTYAGNYRRQETVPGIFAEHTMQFFDKKLTWIAGIRADQHNEFGTRFTPRSLIKYDLTPETVIRANIGTGWRTVNLFSENINLLASSRDVIFEETLQPEEALNYGINLTHKFETPTITGFVGLDFYRTVFQNQIFPDYDTDPSKAFIKNFSGTSIGEGLQIEGSIKFWDQLEFKTGYNY
ncbi:MAG: TonB-dependent receptor, partial [Bacteroidota bacterium]